MNPFAINDELAIVTGGGTGLGFGMAKALINSGARVVLVGRRQDVLDKAVKELGPKASAEVGDVANSAENPNLAAKIEKRHGPVSILINNAGQHLRKAAIDTTAEEMLAIMHTHVIGAFALTRALLPGMIQRKDGKIIFISSMGAVFGVPLIMGYSAAKASHIAMARCLATEVGVHGVRVNVIAPGWIDSDITRPIMARDPERKQKIVNRTPLGKFGEADDIGWAAAYLCSPAARFVTGVVLPIDGGASIGF